jgi:hypothetical protein
MGVGLRNEAPPMTPQRLSPSSKPDICHGEVVMNGNHVDTTSWVAAQVPSRRSVGVQTLPSVQLLPRWPQAQVTWRRLPRQPRPSKSVSMSPTRC